MTVTAPVTVGGKTAEEWREAAASSRRASQESWERSDTDGFLSQWASDQMAMRYSRLAQVAEDGGYLRVTAFVDLATGALVKGEWRTTKYGSGYAPFEHGQWIFPSEASNPEVRARNNTKKGYREVTCLAPALVDRDQRP